MPSTFRRRVTNGRLQYFGSTADESFWADHWSEERARSYYARAAHGRLGTFEEIFTRHLPRQGRILEAGCGPGHLVVALRARGYECEGVEWAEATVALARSVFPDLPIRCGDVTDLDTADGTYAALISLGVVEHREEGPEPFLAEFHRVLGDGGLLLLSVPSFNRLRRLKARLGAYRADVRGLAYYQQAFTREDFRACLQRSGFEVVEVVGYDPALGLASEVPAAAALLATAVGRRLRARLNRSALACRGCPHMAMFVCRALERAGS